MGPPLQTSVLGRDQVVNSSAGRGKCAPDERLGLRVLGFRDVWGVRERGMFGVGCTLIGVISITLNGVF